MRIRPVASFLIPDHFKTQEMCIKAAEVDPWQVDYIPDHFKTQEMCDKAVREVPFSLQYVPHWLVILNIMMMMIVLSGTMVIKNVGPRKQK